jgi:myxalamid-type polyketide synthase MxaB
MRVFTPAQGLAALEKIMTSREPQVGVSEVTDWNVVKSIFPHGRHFEEMKSEGSEDNRFDKYNYLIDEIKKATTTEERKEKIQLYIGFILKQTLNLPESEVLDIDQNFAEFGVDSLMAMEMKNRFQAVVGDRSLTISSLQENRTIRSLSAYLAHVMENEEVVLRPLEELIAEDVILPPDIQPATIAAVKPSDFQHILLLGKFRFFKFKFLFN